MTPRRRNAIVGIVVLGAMFAFGWMILQFSSRSAGSLFAKGTEFTIVADRVDGVSEGTPITYLGVNVGRVATIRRVPGKREVVLTATLNEGEQVPVNVLATIRPQSALGPSATIGLEVEKEPSPQNLGKDSVVRATHTGGGLIPPEFGELATEIRERELIQHATRTVEELRQQLRKVGTTLDAINEVVADPKVKTDLKTSVANIEQFSHKLNQVADEANATMKQVRTTVDGGGKRFDEIARDLGGRLTQISQTLEKVNSVATKIDKGQGTAGLFINDPRLYESFVDTAREMNLTVADLRRLVQQWEEEGFRLKL